MSLGNQMVNLQAGERGCGYLGAKGTYGCVPLIPVPLRATHIRGYEWHEVGGRRGDDLAHEEQRHLRIQGSPTENAPP
jgi:hypothetical protein